jgi:hypothetical protein
MPEHHQPNYVQNACLFQGTHFVDARDPTRHVEVFNPVEPQVADDEYEPSPDDPILNYTIDFLDFLENEACALGDIPQLFESDLWTSFQVELIDPTHQPPEFMIVERKVDEGFQYMLLIKDVGDYPDEPYIQVHTGELHFQEFFDYARDLVREYLEWLANHEEEEL